MNEQIKRGAVILLCAFACIVCKAEEEVPQKECSSGSVCFPQGYVPEDVTPEDTAYYCCLEKNWSRHQVSVNGTAGNCSCHQDFSVDAKIQLWAERTKDAGRMCIRGETACEGAAVASSWNFRFETCCLEHTFNQTHVTQESTTFDSDKAEYIGCRCTNHPVPTPDPRAYVPPPVAGYNSSGEVCSYDDGCSDRPALKCQGLVTFCCYGSRGMVTANEGDGITHCTCTNEIFGTQCTAMAVPISHTSQSCLTSCEDKAESEKCTDDHNEYCCPHNMALSAQLQDGNFTSCTCQALPTPRDTMCKVELVLPSSAWRLTVSVSQVLATVGALLLAVLGADGEGL